MTTSVLQTQEPMLALEREVRETEQRLAVLKERLALAIEAHREQIRRSLDSKLPEEREMAEDVAVWYDVLTVQELEARRPV